MLASASDAIVILAFNVRPVGDARAVAEREGVEIRHYAVIYRAIEELRDAMQGMLAPEEVEEALGTAEVRQIFRASRVGHDRRLPRHRRPDHPRLEGPAGARRHRHLHRRDPEPASLQRGRARGGGRLRLRRSCSATTRTSKKATCSRPTRRARSSASWCSRAQPRPLIRRQVAADVGQRFRRGAGDRPALSRRGEPEGKRKELSSIKAQLHGRLGAAVAETDIRTCGSGPG